MKQYVVGICGVVLCALGAFLVIGNYVDGSWPRVPGTVIGSREMAGKTSPIVEYEALDTTFQVISSDQPLFSSYEAGQTLRVAYNPNSPGEAKIAASGFIAVIAWLLLLLGAAAIIVSVVLHTRLQRLPRDDDDDTEPEELADPPADHLA